jgi:selenocysteine lyase/cysteine desulfurase
MGHINMTQTIFTHSNAGDVFRAKEAVEEAAERVRLARRDFLKLFGYGTAGLVMSGLTLGKDATARGVPAPYASPLNRSPYGREFEFAGDLLYMNIGTTGSSPTRVIDDYYQDYQDVAGNPTAYFFGQQMMRNSIAPGFGCDPYELVMSFNTTDGLWRIVMGIPFEPGDEVITTNMEEDAGISAAGIIRDRYGVVIKSVNVPTNDAYSDRELIRRFKAQLTPNTKAILFSSPIYLTGGRLPEKELCLRAARRGVISIVDGAHLPGMCTINLHDMGCDFFTGAGHKWQCGPGQTGFLYIRNNSHPERRVVQRPTSDFAPFGGPSEMVDIPIPGYSNTNPLPTYYPTNTLIYGAAGILANGVRDPEHNIAAVLQLIGNGSRPSQNALTEVCQMWDEWGRQEIEDYIVSLAQYLRAQIVDIWGPQTLSLPYSREAVPAARTGLTSFNPFSPGFVYNGELSPEESSQQATDSSDAVSTLRSAYNIVVRNNLVPHTLRSDSTQNAVEGTLSSPLRISTHLFHSMDDVDRLIHALLEVAPRP